MRIFIWIIFAAQMSLTALSVFANERKVKITDGIYTEALIAALTSDDYEIASMLVKAGANQGGRIKARDYYRNYKCTF